MIDAASNDAREHGIPVQPLAVPALAHDSLTPGFGVSNSAGGLERQAQAANE